MSRLWRILDVGLTTKGYIMGLIDDLSKIEIPVSPCGVARLFETLPPDESKALIQAVDDLMLPASRIAYALKNNGHPISTRTIQRHRARGTAKDCCACQ